VEFDSKLYGAYPDTPLTINPGQFYEIIIGLTPYYSTFFYPLIKSGDLGGLRASTETGAHWFAFDGKITKEDTALYLNAYGYYWSLPGQPKPPEEYQLYINGKLMIAK